MRLQPSWPIRLNSMEPGRAQPGHRTSVLFIAQNIWATADDSLRWLADTHEMAEWAQMLAVTVTGASKPQRLRAQGSIEQAGGT